jgi:hypothetical protein
MAQALSNNPNYLVNIVCDNPFADIVANMPEEISLAAHSNWQPLFPNSTLAGLVGQVSSGMLGTMAARGLQLSGGNALVQELTWQVWESTDPLEFSINLLFDAVTDAKKEVLIPMVTLESLVLPYGANGILFPPGPAIVSAKSGSPGYTCLYLGNFAVFAPIIITSVANTFDVRLDTNGIPIAGRSEVSIRTGFTFGRTDLFAAFYMDSTGGTIGAQPATTPAATTTDADAAAPDGTGAPASTPTNPTPTAQASSMVQGNTISGTSDTQIPTGGFGNPQSTGPGNTQIPSGATPYSSAELSPAS